MAERCSVSTAVPIRRRDFAITSPVAHAAARWRCCLLQTIIACLKNSGARWCPDKVKQALRSAASKMNPFLDDFRIPMFRWLTCHDKREFQPGSLKTKVAIHSFSSKTSRQRASAGGRLTSCPCTQEVPNPCTRCFSEKRERHCKRTCSRVPEWRWSGGV